MTDADTATGWGPLPDPPPDFLPAGTQFKHGELVFTVESGFFLGKEGSYEGEWRDAKFNKRSALTPVSTITAICIPKKVSKETWVKQLRCRHPPEHIRPSSSLGHRTCSLCGLETLNETRWVLVGLEPGAARTRHLYKIGVQHLESIWSDEEKEKAALYDEWARPHLKAIEDERRGMPIGWTDRPDGDGGHCDRCGMRAGGDYYSSGRAALEHRCALPSHMGKHLYFHNDPEEWPYASKGHDLVTPAELGEWLRTLPEQWLPEIREALNVSNNERTDTMKIDEQTKGHAIAALAGLATGVVGTLGVQELQKLKVRLESALRLLEQVIPKEQ